MSTASSPSHSDPATGSARAANLALPQALAHPAPYPGATEVELRETHASWVFLAGEYAYKVKKPVRLAFLDYSTLARRRAACREEVRVNRALAPGIYLGVTAIVARAAGLRFAPENAPGAVEYAIRMRRFDDGRTIEGAIRARTLSRAEVGSVARRLAGFHRRTPAVAGGKAADLLATWRDNVDEIARLEHPAAWDVGAMGAFGEAFVTAHGREIARRVREGCVRDCHGDLRCEHVLLGDPIRVVDRIEFDPSRRHIDVACDLAFLTMDLEAHRRRWAALELIAAYRHGGGSPGSERLRSYYAAYWALVRAKVVLIGAKGRTGATLRGQRGLAARLWKLAELECWRARLPLVILMCGPAASGKSTLAAELSRRSGLPVVSSDALRKRHAGLAATERARPEHYGEEFTRTTYELLSREALSKLDRKGGVIVDATCQRRVHRARLLHRLQLGSATFLAVHCRVTLETALARAAARMDEAGRISDATPGVVAAQFRRFEPLAELPPGSVLLLDAERNTEALVARVTRAVDERIRAGERHGAASDPCFPASARGV
jgi:uncharacterized protein